MAEEERPPIESIMPTIDERIAELKTEGKTNKDMVLILYNEGYSTKAIMEHRLPLKALKKRADTDDAMLGAIAGTSKGAGYLDELKQMIRSQISRNRQLTEFCADLGLGILLGALNKAGLTMEEFSDIALKREGLREALTRAGETAFKALEYYETDLVSRVEGERDEARAFASVLEAKIEDLVKLVDPRFRMERMIQTYLLSGGAETDILTGLLDRWLEMEMADLRLELMR